MSHKCRVKAGRCVYAGGTAASAARARRLPAAAAGKEPAHGLSWRVEPGDGQHRKQSDADPSRSLGRRSHESRGHSEARNGTWHVPAGTGRRRRGPSRRAGGRWLEVPLKGNPADARISRRRRNLFSPTKVRRDCLFSASISALNRSNIGVLLIVVSSSSSISTACGDGSSSMSLVSAFPYNSVL
jgi:hypothetical protein